MNVLKPSTVLRRVKAGTLQAYQPGHILCEEHRHRISGTTESPTFWESGLYVYCEGCKARVLARAVFAEFEIDLRGERKTYPLHYEERT